MAATINGSYIVVDEQFCAPHPVILTVVKKASNWSGGDSVVNDESGNVIFRVDSMTFGLRERRILLGATGNPLVSLQKKILSSHERWQVFRGNSSREEDLLFSVRRSSLFQIKPELHVFLASNTSEATCDFKVEGSYFRRSCAVHLEDSNTILARMSREFTLENAWLQKDMCVVTIDPNVDSAFIISLIAILDEMNKRKETTTST